MYFSTQHSALSTHAQPQLPTPMKVFSSLEPSQRQNLLSLFAAGLLFWSSLASLLPTLPSYVADVGATKQEVGVVIGAFAIGLLLFRSWLGRMADRRGRKVVLVLGTFVVAIAPLGYLFVKSIPLLIVLRAFHGVSIAAFTTSYSALVVDLSPVDQRGEVIGYMSLVNPVGVAIGPAVGGLLQAQYGYTPLFLLSAGLGLLSILCSYVIKEERVARVEKLESSQELEGLQVEKWESSQTPNLVEPTATDAGFSPQNRSSFKPSTASVPANSGKPSSKSFWQMLWSPRLRIPALVLLLIGLAFGALTTFVPLFIKETKVDLNAGWFYTAAAMSSFSIRIFTGRASDRYGRGVFISCSLVAYSLAMLILSLADSAIAFLLAGLIEGAGSGTFFPMMIALISDRSSPQERGQVFALCISGSDLGVAIAGPVLGSFAEQLGYRGIFTISAGLCLVAIIVFITQSGKDFPHSLRFALGRERDVYALDNHR